jgi:hypothetical protein
MAGKRGVVDLTEEGPDGKEGMMEVDKSLASLREALSRKRKERREAERRVAALREEEQELELLIEGIEDQEESARRARNRPDWAGAFAWDQQVDRLLQQTFKLPRFRACQREIINSTLSKWDTLVLMPTGGGKSLVYMLPALVESGVTLVVSPLISLMHDQVTHKSTIFDVVGTNGRQRNLSLSRAHTHRHASTHLLGANRLQRHRAPLSRARLRLSARTPTAASCLAWACFLKECYA